MIHEEVSIYSMKTGIITISSISYFKTPEIGWTVSVDMHQDWKATSRRFSVAFKDIRIEMEKDDYLMMVNASRKNVSTMNNLIGSSGGMYGYLLDMNKRFSRDTYEVVRLLDKVDDLALISSVSEQKDFRQKWLEQQMLPGKKK